MSESIELRDRKRNARLLTNDSVNLVGLGPIIGYAQEPLLTLDQTCVPLVGILNDIREHVLVALQHTPAEPANGLTYDESAAIRLYTMEWIDADKSLYSILNRTLRTADRDSLKPWYKYLKLFLTALSKIPCEPQQVIWRGVRSNISDEFPTDALVTWWAFSSCTTSLRVLENDLYLGNVGARTLFSIEAFNARNIRYHSFFGDEDEMLMLPGTYMQVQSQFNPASDLYIVHLKQQIPNEMLLEPPFKNAWVDCNISLIESRWYRKKKFLISMGSLVTLAVIVIVTLGCVLGLRRISNTSSSGARQYGVTVAGGHGQGNATNQLDTPYGIFVDDDQTILIAEWGNDRIIQWKMSDTNGEVVAGGHGTGDRLDQLKGPTDVWIDNETDSIIICDRWNYRVVRWSRTNRTSQGKILVENIHCSGIAMDDQRYLYVSETDNSTVWRYEIGDKNGTLVAGGNGTGDGLNQLNTPYYIFVDQQQAVYVSDNSNHRIVKWNKGATTGVVVAGGHGNGDALEQLSLPEGLFVDNMGTLYVSENGNDRVSRWPKGATQGTIIAGGNGHGGSANQLSRPDDLTLDRYGNLYVVDSGNYRVQRFSIKQT
ncbi:unnamed protein product [Rotaria magnacalcarata]|uniref:NAD(P)(+)--arginine ADP-ribosyltransferase n=3 Tax=Rotaria magnacalcarata TaxID=392030 RepID=A0A816LJF8_9BILA|nr:unnamed protein product [Rotaria magnacalcarata]CAF4148868.1 unnamed protein product [Rotaria magnacalcarata]